ncbi:hypothetical protein TWF481_006803 [Arthrobotrys musiformis]|uniref:Uncharacterized protein n=1 Tax=Arthrobotrys musiformis TaxID=47236 RepID=A0AAV9WBH7_9PEZI
MAAFALTGAFISLGPLDEIKDIRAGLSLEDGFWGFKYDTINSHVSVRWAPPNGDNQFSLGASKYILRLWSGRQPTNMAATGTEEMIEFDGNNLPWERAVPKIKLEGCFWFGIEKVRGGPSSTKPEGSSSPSTTSSPQSWSDLIREMENTIATLVEVAGESDSWMLVAEKLQKSVKSNKPADLKAIAQGRRAEWARGELKRLQGGVDEVRRIINSSAREQGGHVESPGIDLNTLDGLKLQNEKLTAGKVKLLNDIRKLEKKIAAQDVDISELSETVYRLQLENDELREADKGTSDDDSEIQDDDIYSLELPSKREEQPESKRQGKAPVRIHSPSIEIETTNTQTQELPSSKPVAESSQTPQRSRARFPIADPRVPRKDGPKPLEPILASRPREQESRAGEASNRPPLARFGITGSRDHGAPLESPKPVKSTSPSLATFLVSNSRTTTASSSSARSTTQPTGAEAQAQAQAPRPVTSPSLATFLVSNSRTPVRQNRRRRSNRRRFDRSQGQDEGIRV